MADDTYETSFTRCVNDRETSYNHCGDKDSSDKNYCFFSSSERKGMNRLRKLINKHPDEVTVISDTEECIYIKCPASWMPFPRPPKKVNLTDEQRAERAETMRKARMAKGSGNVEDDGDQENDDDDGDDEDEENGKDD